MRTNRTRVRRVPNRGTHDRRLIDAILDEALVAHLAFVHDGGPAVIPTLLARAGDEVLLHGSAASRALRTLRGGAEACLEVTLVDGLVLARSAFHHSINYRSVVLYGTVRTVEDPAERVRALRAFTEKLIPGRWEHVRPPSPQELKATAVLALPIDEGSAKVRTGPPLDDEPDYASEAWAGVVPLRTVAGPPAPDPRLRPGIPLPDHVTALAART
jgi:nitroimidazol reductase NimA-like FMN-containing flavoprotein (pyridoxamine 5'-phosphate oxidase superfamily)